MAIRQKFNPPVDPQTFAVSAKLAGVAILRPLPGGGYIGFETAGDAIGHPTAARQPGQQA